MITNDHNIKVTLTINDNINRIVVWFQKDKKLWWQVIFDKNRITIIRLNSGGEEKNSSRVQFHQIEHLLAYCTPEQYSVIEEFLFMYY